jgi:hypothetical protein
VENVQLGSWEWVEVVVFDSAFKKKKKKDGSNPQET